MDTPEGVVVLAGTVIDDVLGIVLLAVVLGIIGSSQGTEGMDWALVGSTAGKAAGVPFKAA